MAFHGVGSINGIAKRSQGQEIISIGAGNQGPAINIYKTNPGTTQLISIQGPGAMIAPSPNTSLSISTNPDGTLIAAGSNFYPFLVIYQKINNVFTALPLLSPSPGAAVYATKFSPDGSKLAVTSNGGGLLIYNITGTTFTSLPINIIPSSTFVYGVGWSPNSSLLSVSGSTGLGNAAVYYVTGSTATQFVTGLSSTTSYCSDWSPIDPLVTFGNNNGFNTYYYNGSGTGTRFTSISNGYISNVAIINMVAYNNTSSGYITTSSIAIQASNGPRTVYNLSLAGTATVQTAVGSVPAGANGITLGLFWNSSGTTLIGTTSAGQLGMVNRTGNSYVTSSTYIPPVSASSNVQHIDYNTSTNLITLFQRLYPYIAQISWNKNTGVFTDQDCWGRTPQGYSFSSIIPVNPSAVIFNARFNPGGSNPPGTILAVANNSAPLLSTYLYDTNANTWTSITTAFTASTVGTIIQMSWSPNGQILTVAGNTNPYINNYYVSGTGTATTFTKLAQPIDPWNVPLNATYSAWSPDNRLLIMSGTGTAPYFTGYAVNQAGASTTFTRFTSTNFVGVDGSTYEFAFNPDGTKLATGFGASPQLRIFDVAYNGTLTTFSTASNTVNVNPGTINVGRIQWSPQGNYVVISGNTSNSVRDTNIYSRNNNTFTLVSTAFTNPPEQDIANGFWSQDESRMGFITSVMTSLDWPGLSSQVRTSNVNTFTSATIVYPTNISLPMTAYNIDYRFDL
jgi:WD40 repeat protein